MKISSIVQSIACAYVGGAIGLFGNIHYYQKEFYFILVPTVILFAIAQGLAEEKL